MFGLYCPTPPSGYSHSRRDGRTCYYTRTLSTTRTAPKTITYTCPSAPTNYTYSSRSGSTCYYTRTQNHNPNSYYIHHLHVPVGAHQLRVQPPEWQHLLLHPHPVHNPRSHQVHDLYVSLSALHIHVQPPSW